MNFWYCNKSGHLKKVCWKRKLKEYLSNEHSNNEANTTKARSGTVDKVLTISNTTSYKYVWLLDSGSSHPMCLHISCFSHYQPINDGIIFMGNDFSWNIIGIGSVKIKMYDGIVRTLT